MLLGVTETKEIQEGYALAVLEPLGIRKTRETRKACALGLQ